MFLVLCSIKRKTTTKTTLIKYHFDVTSIKPELSFLFSLLIYSIYLVQLIFVWYKIYPPKKKKKIYQNIRTKTKKKKTSNNKQFIY